MLGPALGQSLVTRSATTRLPRGPRSLAQDTRASGALSEAECSGSAERRHVLPGPASMRPRPESQRGSCHERTPADPAAPTQPQAWLSPTVALGAWGMALTRSYRGASLRFHPPVNPPWRDLTALVRTGHLARGRDAPQGCSLASGASGSRPSRHTRHLPASARLRFAPLSCAPQGPEGASAGPGTPARGREASWRAALAASRPLTCALRQGSR